METRRLFTLNKNRDDATDTKSMKRNNQHQPQTKNQIY